jgi:SAM-dependent methyltransferase
MKKKFIFLKNQDISSRHVNFFNIKNYSLRNRFRDYFDTIIRRPFYSLIYNNFFKKQNYIIDLVLPSKGLSTVARRKKLNKIKIIKNKSILNIGCGNAFDYHYWFKFNPKKIVGVDILNYKHSWEKVKNFAKHEKIKTKVEFYKKDFTQFKYQNKFDFIVSDAVFEHCKDFSQVIKNCYKLLKKDGIMYASYGGPMWLTYGGDHFSGRDNKKNGFNHLLLNKKKYEAYFNKNAGTLNYELNEGGGGGILVQEDLFSKLNANEYIEILKRNKFKLIKTYVEYCPIGYELLRNNPRLYERLIKKNPSIPVENYYLKTHIVYLKKQ